MATKSKKDEASKSESVEREPLTDLNSQADDQATPGSFVEVTGGDHKGAYGAFVAVTTYTDGQPHICLVRTRDENSQLLSVEYDDLTPAEAGRR